MGFLSRLREGLQRFMYGRNGVDLLSRDMNIAALIFMLLHLFFRSWILYGVCILFFIASTFRILSRNRAKRSAENVKYFNSRTRIKNLLAAKRQEFANRRLYRYYRCSNCKQRVRVPKGKGKIEITCPKCKSRFIKKT